MSNEENEKKSVSETPVLSQGIQPGDLNNVTFLSTEDMVITAAQVDISGLTPLSLEEARAIMGITHEDHAASTTVLLTGVSSYQHGPFGDIYESPRAGSKKTNFELVSEMNEAFNNPKGDPRAIKSQELLNQVMNIPNEFGELMVSFGADKEVIDDLVEKFKDACLSAVEASPQKFNFNKFRDALCDIHVFAYGAHHRAGVDANEDMEEVVESVMTRFIKNDLDKEATIAKHAAQGVTDVYFEGEYPYVVIKSASNQPDAPAGKFLKSASHTEPKFRAYD